MKIKNITLLAAFAAAAAFASSAHADFVAYTRVQDVATGNVTRLDLGDSGLLKDFTSGDLTSVTTTVVGGNGISSTGYFQMPNSGTEAYNTFNGKITGNNTVGYGTEGWFVDLDFTGLDSSKTYEFVTLLNRASNDDRWTVISIVDADASIYASTSTAYKISETAVSMVANQQTTGEVARWTGIKSGVDGGFSIHVTHASLGAGIDIPIGATQNGPRAYGPAGFMLVETTSIPEPGTMSLLAIGGLGVLLMRRRRRA